MSVDVMTKDQWVALFREIGLDDETMMRWHRLFETRYPQGHQSFLEWLQVSGDEIARIRALWPVNKAVPMFTIGQVAKKFSLSRSTLLYS